jgi:hypothetical protein
MPPSLSSSNIESKSCGDFNRTESLLDNKVKPEFKTHCKI